MARRGMLLAWVVLILQSSFAHAQTTAGTSATIVVPVIAQTSSFGSVVTAYDPNPGAITVNVAFYDALNTASPGLKACTALSVPAGASVQFSVAGQCALPAGSNFGLLILTEATGTQRFYGYARTQTPQGVGFSTEGFPIENFNDQVQHVTGLERVAAAGGLPAFQTNCFVAALGDAVDYELQLFNGTTNTQLGGTLSGTLQPWQQYRYLDVFAQAGVPAGNYTDVRAQFTNLTGAEKKLIGFCTVQENTSFSADFRIAKSYGGTPQNAFVQGGNAFGTTALLGTVDNQALNIQVNGQSVMTYLPNATSPNLVGGHPHNSAGATFYGQTIGGGGVAGSDCFDPATGTYTHSCGNQTAGYYATVAGGFSNSAGALATVAGGTNNSASGEGATVAGGTNNSASGGFSTVAGGFENSASGDFSFAMGQRAKARATGMFAWADSQSPVFDFVTYRAPASSNDTFNVRATGGVVFVTGIDSGTGWPTWECYTYNGGGWTCSSDRNLKQNLAPIDGSAVLAKVVQLPVYQWQPKDGSNAEFKHVGPMAQDFYAAFGLGDSDKAIGMQDAEGVTLAAIQGLHQLIQEKDAKIEAQQRRITELEDRVVQVESLRGEMAALKSALAEMRDGQQVPAQAVTTN